jgi:hypothetical protein
VATMLPDLRSSESRSASGAYSSTQCVELPSPVVEHSLSGARRLGDVYWREVERSTIRLVRVREAFGGVELRLLGVGPPLLRFAIPDLDVDSTSVSCAYSITGGLLARRPMGSIRFVQTVADGVQLWSAISDFYPRLAAERMRPDRGGMLYRQLQARLHVVLSRRYFARLWREGG